MQPLFYVGVRVKNPVKDLIMQKYRNQRSWSSNHQNQDNAPWPEMYLDITDKMLQTESAPISITTAHMKGLSSQAVPPHADTPPKTSVCPVYPPTDPESLPAAMGNGFYTQPFTPQPDAPPPLHSPPVGAHSGVSFFQWQIKQEEEKVARLTLEQLVAQDSDGDTCLHIAVAQGRRALSYVLARNMAQISISMLDVKEQNGQSALQVSVAANQHLIVQDLISLGAQVNSVDCWGRSPLHVCAENGHVLTLQAIHKALETTGQKVDMETVNYDGLTALHTAVLSHNAVLKDLEGEAVQQSPQTQVLVQRRIQLGGCIRTLLQMGASCRTKDHKSGRTSLHMAAEEASVELLHLFLDQPNSLAITNDMTYDGNTALHIVSALTGRVAQVDAVRLLMRRGADISIKNLEKDQPSQLVAQGPVGDTVWRILKGRQNKPRPSPY
ncbi:hypothetical protein SKAU_G00254890 [Synaphobranchus kaupii]|uniref:OCA domain-containing protein n=1 Tax=Synaphobranchus kaupii TaxID=118154 RepID=A0A9Q1IQ53_SYNKA|nr:hypothetical protein SKAU_G00254890 [Synaphobranchus kaupii]